MIKRTNDYSLFSEKEFSKIANVVSKNESKKIFDTFSDIEKARIAAKELKIQGYNAEVFQSGNMYEVHVTKQDNIDLKVAENSGAFKKLAFGRYVFERNSSLEMHNYPFNHGSIWRVSTDDQGNQVLVKECDDENEDEVLRKTASLKKVANGFDYVEDNNFNNVFKLIFNITALNQIGTNFLNDLYNNSASNLKIYFIEKLNEDLNEYVSQVSSSKTIMPNSPELEDVQRLIKEKFDMGQYAAISDIDRTIDEYLLEKKEEEIEDLT